MSSTSHERRWHEQLTAEHLTASSWSEGPHVRFAAHRHAYDKVLVVTSGSIVFMLPDLATEVTLEVGDRLDLPAETTHAALVGPAGVVCLEAHPERGRLSSTPLHRPGWVRDASPKAAGPRA